MTAAIFRLFNALIAPFETRAATRFLFFGLLDFRCGFFFLVWNLSFGRADCSFTCLLHGAVEDGRAGQLAVQVQGTPHCSRPCCYAGSEHSVLRKPPTFALNK